MKVSRLMTLWLALSVLLPTFVFAQSSTTPRGKTQGKPNVIFILADDLG